MTCKNQRQPTKKFSKARIPSCALRCDEEKNRIICKAAGKFKSMFDENGNDCLYAHGSEPDKCPLFERKS